MGKKNILVCGGGGCKGAIQIQALAKQEQCLGPLHEYYSLMVGTSVGSINAAAIASGRITAYELNRRYDAILREVFTKRPWYQCLKLPKYQRKYFINIWMDLIGNIKMNECKTKLLITSVDRCSDRNHYFKSWTKDGEQLLVTEICKSFAAPFYFSQINDPVNQCVWFDGGVGTSNISLEEALTEAVLLGWEKEDITIDVFGCGFVDNKISFAKACKERTLSQLFDFIQLKDGGLARSQSREDKIARIKKVAHEFSNIHFNYWDIEIEKKYDGMDKIKYLSQYREYGKKMALKPLISI